MYKLFKNYIPSLCISFTFVIIYATLYNLLNGFYKNGFLLFIVEVFVYLVIVMFIDYFISLIDFKNYRNYFIVETILLYPITIGTFMIGHWLTLQTNNIIWISFIYIIGIRLVHYYFYILSQKQAHEINDLIQSKTFDGHRVKE